MTCRKKLKRRFVPDFLYNLDGKGRTDERLNLEFSNGAWYVFYEERGVKTTNLRFETEDEACEFIYKYLKLKGKLGFFQ